MVKNQANQTIGAEMVSASTGGAFVGTVTVYVTVDGGTQAIGGNGVGICVAEGNGYYSYTPTKAETNGDLIAFTFTGGGAIPATIQVATFTAAQVSTLNAGGPGPRTGQDLLNMMELLFPEKQLQPGETDVVQGLRALNAAQYYWESLMALEAEIMGDRTGTVITTTTGVTIANGGVVGESTPYPTGLLRLDRLQFIDPAVPDRPSWDLEPIRRTGGHIMTPGWPYNVLNFVSAGGGGGKPVAYYTDARSIYWVPRPDLDYTVRWYGLQAAADITATGAFQYDDRCMLPMAIFAVKLLRTGLDDPIENYLALAKEVFDPAIKMLSNYKRERAPGYEYRWMHNS